MYEWNGEPCKAKQVLVEILPGEGFFKWWQPYVGKIMQGMLVTQNEESFCIYNGDGSARRKLLAGGGPNMPSTHFENYMIWDAGDIETAKYIYCTTHEWSEDKKPIFKTETKYCIKCRTPEILTKMLKEYSNEKRRSKI